MKWEDCQYSFDVIHETPRRSTYIRTDYIVNSDMTIPQGLTAMWIFRERDEDSKRVGIHGVGQNPPNRLPQNNPLALHPAKIPLAPPKQTR